MRNDGKATYRRLVRASIVAAVLLLIVCVSSITLKKAYGCVWNRIGLEVAGPAL